MAAPSNWGTVKSYNPKKGFGFIVSAHSQGDVMFGRAEIPAQLQAVDLAGSEVGFDVNQSDKGARACNLKFANLPPQSNFNGAVGKVGSAATFQGAMAGLMGGKGAAAGAPGVADVLQMMSQFSQQGAIGNGQQHYGHIKSCNPQKGFGFIVSASFEGDVWFSTKDMPPEIQQENLRNAPCYFEAAYNGDNPTRIRATSVQLTSGTGGGAGGSMPFSTSTDQTGTVKLFNGRFGFIVGNSQGALMDGIYFKPHDIVNYTSDAALQNQSVTFDLMFHKDGKPQAKNIKIGGRAKRPADSSWGQSAAKRIAPSVPAGTSLNGVVKSFRPLNAGGPGKGGFGFISCDEADGEDVWFSQSALPAECQQSSSQMLVGRQVAFSVRYKPDGKMAGDEVRM